MEANLEPSGCLCRAWLPALPGGWVVIQQGLTPEWTVMSGVGVWALLLYLNQCFVTWVGVGVGISPVKSSAVLRF